MTAAQILAAGIVHLCTPGPQVGWPHHIQDELDRRDAAHRAEQAADFGTRAWRAAHVQRIGAETRLAAALGVAAVRPAV